jgi:hypothetical protein
VNSRVANVAIVVAVLGVGMSCGGSKSPGPTPVCSIAISPGSLAFGSDGGTGTVTVTVASGCAWSATASAPWVTITGGSSGSGAGTVAYTVAANASTDARNAALTVGGQTHAVAQQGRVVTTCTYAISPASADFGKDAATGTVAVTAPPGCTWTAASNSSWVSVTSGGQGSGNGSVAYSVARNLDVAGRTGTVTVAGRSFTIRQGGDIGGCQYSVAPVSFNPCMPGGTVAATMTTQASCPWTATVNTSWLEVASGSSGSGPGPISISYSDNYDAPRDGVVEGRWPTPTAGQNIHVTQAGCLYAVSKSSFSFGSGAGSGTFDVFQMSDPNTCGGPTQDRCVWTATSDVPWITITSSMPRSGDNPVAFTVAANTGTAQRQGRITVRDKVVTITQAGS